MKRAIPAHELRRILANETLHPNALLANEAAGDFSWHNAAHEPKSSQVFCVSAFGTLRHLEARDTILHRLLGPLFSAVQTKSARPRRWDIGLEVEDADLLGEHGVAQPTSIDAVLTSSQEVICIESKFIVDAWDGLGGCRQALPNNGKPPSCHGFYGPHSDAKMETLAWCRLETWEGRRSPRLYWLLGRSFFQPHLFDRQQKGDECPFRGGNYQLMRNFLTAAMRAQRDGKTFFGVVVICPQATCEKIAEQVGRFRKDVLLSDFSDRVQFVTYEQYIGVLRTCGDEPTELGTFLEGRIRELAANISRATPASGDGVKV